MAAPEVGGFLPTFEAPTVRGDTVVVGAPGRRQLVFVFTSTCPYCRATLPRWRGLAEWAGRAAGRPVQVIALSLDSLPAARTFAAAEGLPFSVAVFPNRQLRQLSRAGRVPQTLVLDDGGLVLYSRLGALSEAAADSVRRALRWERPDSTARPTPAGAAAPAP